MPLRPIIQNIDIPDAGDTVTLLKDDNFESYAITLTGTKTMTGNTSITSNDDVNSPGAIYEVEFPGGAILGAQTFTIFGEVLTHAQALNPCLVRARWDGTTYHTQVYTDWGASNTVESSHINSNAVTTAKILDANVTLAKLVGISRGSMLRGSATGTVEEVDMKRSGRVPLGDGTDVISAVLSQDIASISGAGEVTIANNAITTAKIIDDAVTLAKMAGLARGNMIRGNASGDPEAYDLAAIGAGAVVMTDGVDILGQLFSGGISVDGAGVVTVSPWLNIYVTKVIIPTASVLTANTFPIVLVGSPGSNKSIKPLSGINNLEFNRSEERR